MAHVSVLFQRRSRGSTQFSLGVNAVSQSAFWHGDAAFYEIFSQTALALLLSSHVVTWKNADHLVKEKSINEKGSDRGDGGDVPPPRSSKGTCG